MLKAEGENLKGEVKQYSQMVYGVSIVDGEVVKNELGDNSSSKIMREYDRSGRLIKSGDYDSNGSFANENTYKYDANNRIIESKGFYYGSLTGIALNEYNNKGIIDKTVYQNEDGELLATINYRYDKADKTLHGSLQAEDGKSFDRLTKRVDDAGNIVAIVMYDEWGNEEERMEYTYMINGLISETVYIEYDDKEVNGYSYDENANLKEMIVTYSDGDEVVITYEYKFDENGNWIQRLEYFDGVLRMLTEREYKYY